MPFTVTFTATAFVAGSLRTSGNTLLVDDPTARMLVDLGVATATGLTPQTGAVAPNLARTDGATFTGLLTTVASTTTSAGFNLPHGTAPSAPVNGDVWSTTSNIQWRRNGGTATLANTNTGNTYGAGQKQNFSHNSTTAGIAVTGVAGDPSTPANGDFWLNSTTAYLNARSNGMTGQVGAVRSWVNFNGTGTVAIRASYNVTSITDNGVGDYSVNFTTALADANYSATALAQNTTNNFGVCLESQTTAALRLSTRNTSNAVLFDCAIICVAILR